LSVPEPGSPSTSLSSPSLPAPLVKKRPVLPMSSKAFEPGSFSSDKPIPFAPLPGSSRPATSSDSPSYPRIPRAFRHLF
jgi:hypothetical protein